MSECKHSGGPDDSRQCRGKEGRMGGCILPENKLIDERSGYRMKLAKRRVAQVFLLLLLLGGDFSSLFSTLPLLLPPDLAVSLSVSLFLYASLVFMLLVLCGVLSFVSFLFISPSCRCSLLFSLSSSMNYLSCEVPYLFYIAPVDLLS